MISQQQERSRSVQIVKYQIPNYILFVLRDTICNFLHSHIENIFIYYTFTYNIQKMQLITYVASVLYIFLIYFCFGPHKIISVPPFIWWSSLSATTTLIFLYTVYGKICKESNLRKFARVVCFCYMHRAIFMHCTVERDCFWDLPLCSPLWGRTVACIGELTFVYMASRQLLHNNKISNIIVFLISIAETISFIGVMKKHYYWFFIENIGVP